MGLETKIPQGVLLTSVEKVLGFGRSRSIMPNTFGLACCAIEMMATGSATYDMARYGLEVFRGSPRHSDLMVVAGRVTQKMAPILRNLYDQMAEPKYVMSMGVCATSGGMFNNYAVVQGVDHVVPVDVYVPGCPPRPELLLEGFMRLREKILNEQLVERPRPGESMEAFRARTGWVDGEVLDPNRHNGDMAAPSLHRITPRSEMVAGRGDRVSQIRSAQAIQAGTAGAEWAKGQ